MPVGHPQYIITQPVLIVQFHTYMLCYRALCTIVLVVLYIVRRRWVYLNCLALFVSQLGCRWLSTIPSSGWCMFTIMPPSQRTPRRRRFKAADFLVEIHVSWLFVWLLCHLFSRKIILGFCRTCWLRIATNSHTILDGPASSSSPNLSGCDRSPFPAWDGVFACGDDVPGLYRFPMSWVSSHHWKW